MNIIISTQSEHKQLELSRYFHNIGLKPVCVHPRDCTNLTALYPEQYLCVWEQTKLMSKSTSLPSSAQFFEEVVHHSCVSIEVWDGTNLKRKDYSASIDGIIFPNLRLSSVDRGSVYDWDDIFVSLKTMKTYQEMKNLGIKNSARDIAFSKMIDDLPEIFKFDKKINLNFNPVSCDEVISFEPFIENLFLNNNVFSCAYKNEFLKKLIDCVLMDGIFIRRAANRKQKNYWLPGLNAGIPLTPKRDEVHELTFMFHDIMHFLFPDLMVLGNTPAERNKYIIYRMTSEAFTLVLADMLFVSVLRNAGVEYDWSKRKIFPLFQAMEFTVSVDNLDKIKELLWANTQFALLGDERALQNLVKNEAAMLEYKSKYARFFQEDYHWTHKNYIHIAQNSKRNCAWLELVNCVAGGIVPNTRDFCPQFNHAASLERQVAQVFEEMFERLRLAVNTPVTYDRQKALTKAIKRYFSGQMAIFYKFETLYNNLFVEQISIILSREELGIEDMQSIAQIYAVYIEKLVQDNYITEYEAQNFKNIYPMFEPFYVFYDKNKSAAVDFKDTLDSIFGQQRDEHNITPDIPSKKENTHE